MGTPEDALTGPKKPMSRCGHLRTLLGTFGCTTRQRVPDATARPWGSAAAEKRIKSVLSLWFG